MSVLLYLLLFWQIRLYSDALEQIYYLGISFYGWYRWTHANDEGSSSLLISVSPIPGIGRQAVLIAAGTAGLGFAMSRVHQFAPVLFPQPASYPYWDAGTTVASFVAMSLLSVKRLESWFWWIGVDVVGIGLYWVKELHVVALLYVLLLGLAIKGVLEWHGEWTRQRGSGVSTRHAII